MRKMASALFFSLLIPAGPALGGPCTAQIDAAQARVDEKIAAQAGSGPTGPESRDAKLHHQPTPRSMAEAEAKLGEGTGMIDAVNSLNEAREADRSGDAARCKQALAKVEAILSGG